MPFSYYDRKELRNTPSFQIGIDPEIEAKYRREGARFILNTGTKMGLPCETMATGVVYFHRFYMVHSFKDFPQYVTACCCLFLAGKVEETPKICDDIIKTARTFLNDNEFTQFGVDPKEEVMTLERILLLAIKFDFNIEHPYSYIVKYAKRLKGDKQKLQKMVQMAWTFVNDSLCTTLCLHWEPEIIAIAFMYLASKLSKYEVVDWHRRNPKHSQWWDMYAEDIYTELLEDICHQVLDLYSGNPEGIQAPPQPPMPTNPLQLGQSANYTFPPPLPTENYTLFSSPVPPPPPYQPPPNYHPVEPPSETQPTPAQYIQPPLQHYPSNYETQGYSNFPASFQQYFQNQYTYRVPPAPQYHEYYNYPQPTQYEHSPVPAMAFPSTGGHPPGYPLQTPFLPIPAAYAPGTAPLPLRPGHLQQHWGQPYLPLTPCGSVDPVTITGKCGQQSWAT